MYRYSSKCSQLKWTWLKETVMSILGNFLFHHIDLICPDILCLPQLCGSDASQKERSRDFWRRCRATWTAWMSRLWWRWTPVQWGKRPLTQKTAAPKRLSEPSPEHIATSSPPAATAKDQPRWLTSPPSTITTPPSLKTPISQTLTPPRVTSLVLSLQPLFAQFLLATTNRHSAMWTIVATPSPFQPSITTSSLTAQQIREAAVAITIIFTMQKTPWISPRVHGN